MIHWRIRRKGKAFFMLKRISMWCLVAGLFCPALARAQIAVKLSPPLVSAVPGTNAPFFGTLTNVGTTTVYFNDLSFGSEKTGVAGMNMQFFALVPASLDPGQSYTGLLFEVGVDGAASPTDYTAQVFFFGGAAPESSDLLFTTSYRVTALGSAFGALILEGVSDLSAVSPFAPLGAFHVSLRNPGATTELQGFDVPLVTTQGSDTGRYSLIGVPAATYDVWIKGAKNLAVLIPGVTVTGSGGKISPATLPAGDANNDNSVDSTDFGVLIGAFNTDGAVAGSGYDPAADLNFDGSVDSTDFGLLIGEFNSAGAP